MPPKAKKKQSAASPQPSPRTPASRGGEGGSVAGGGGGGGALDLPSVAAAAAARHPALMPRGGEGCFSGTVADVVPRGGSRGGEARLWLSEPAMVGAALRPGCLVSVSLISSNRGRSDGSPLDSLFEECNEFFDLDVDNDLMPNEAGRNFVIAKVLPSREVQKNGIKLSWDLACSLGNPSVGCSLFFSPLYTSQAPKETDSVDILRVIKCSNLYLSFVPAKVGSSSEIESESVHHPIRNGMVIESPKRNSSVLSGRNESYDIASHSGPSLCLDPATARSSLADEKINELLQTCASRWLSGRHLLKANYVPLLMCGKLSMFIVMGAEVDGSAPDVVHDKDKLPSNEEFSGKFGEAPVSFLVDRTTKVHLSGSVCSEEIAFVKPGPSAHNSFRTDARNGDFNHGPRLGGLSKESKEIKEIISFSIKDQIGLQRVKDNLWYRGILLSGPPGTGKTSLATSCAYDEGVNLFTINGPEIISQYYGESEQALYDVFSSAKQAAPAVIFIDELDAIAPERKDGSEELSIRIVATLLKLIDAMSPRDRVLVIAATNRPDSIDPALKRPERLDRKIEIGVPSPVQRLDILQHLLVGVQHSLSCEQLESLASATHGFVGADLAALCNEAALSALRRYISLKKSSQQLGYYDNNAEKPDIREINDPLGYQVNSIASSLSKLTMSVDDVLCTSRSYDTQNNGSSGKKDDLLLLVTTEDFEKAKIKVRPSAMREVSLELPKIRWEDVGGQVRIKEQLIEAIELPQKNPKAFENMGVSPPRGLLMIGPPGCSKTLMARAVASEAKLNFLAVKGPELFSKWVGDSEKAVRSLFAKARDNAPAILFFDEIDGLAVTRGCENDSVSVGDRVLSQLLVEMDGLEQRIGVTVIAATNRPDKIDCALLRPGRFDRLLDVQPPDEADRVDIFRIHTRNMPCSHDVNLNELARLTEGYTGADIKLVCRETAIAALDENIDIPEVEIRHFRSAISRIKPSDVKFYQELAAQYSRFVDPMSQSKQ
uniref:AAA+ ATPase domain-containing protein n=1 Tax=Oryza glumipatula TaxID=40148 RepID=A0A0E0BGT4_9ORYZ